MFTGIVEEKGIVHALSPTASGLRVRISGERVLERLEVDDSINVAGACLTVIARDAGSFTCDLVPETLARTNLGGLAQGDPVNLERAATPTSALGGHLVQGHVDVTAALESRSERGEGAVLRFSLRSAVERYVVEKGFIALDGVSLTVSAVHPSAFEVAIIPHTAARTTLSALRPGDLVNVEVDIIAKYVERLLGAR